MRKYLEVCRIVGRIRHLMAKGKATAHVDIRCTPETRTAYRALYEKWMPGKDDPSHEAFLLFLVAEGTRGLTTLRYHPGSFAP